MNQWLADSSLLPEEQRSTSYSGGCSALRFHAMRDLLNLPGHPLSTTATILESGAATTAVAERLSESSRAIQAADGGVIGNAPSKGGADEH
jgi:hypothetical protein